MNNCHSLNNILQAFYKGWGLLQTWTKRLLLFPNLLMRGWFMIALLAWGFIVNLFYGTILELLYPLRLTTINCIRIMTKISSWLARWKKKLISFAGRLQLTRFATWTFGLSSVFPKGVTKKIHSLINNFPLINGLDNKLHTMSWKVTTLPKEKGRLGLPSLDILNFFCKIKLLWRIFYVTSLLRLGVLISIIHLEKPLSAMHPNFGNLYMWLLRELFNGLISR